MLVSRLITLTSGENWSSTARASPHGQLNSAGCGIGPDTLSVSRTYARASVTYGSRSRGSPGRGRSWSTPRPVITSPHANTLTTRPATPEFTSWLLRRFRIRPPQVLRRLCPGRATPADTPKPGPAQEHLRSSPTIDAGRVAEVARVTTGSRRVRERRSAARSRGYLREVNSPE